MGEVAAAAFQLDMVAAAVMIAAGVVLDGTINIKAVEARLLHFMR